MGFGIALQLPYIALDKMLRELMNVTYIFMDFSVTLWDFDLFYFPVWDFFPSTSEMIIESIFVEF